MGGSVKMIIKKVKSFSHLMMNYCCSCCCCCFCCYYCHLKLMCLCCDVVAWLCVSCGHCCCVDVCDLHWSQNWTRWNLTPPMMKRNLCGETSFYSLLKKKKNLVQQVNSMVIDDEEETQWPNCKRRQTCMSY